MSEEVYGSNSVGKANKFYRDEEARLGKEFNRADCLGMIARYWGEEIAKIISQ